MLFFWNFGGRKSWRPNQQSRPYPAPNSNHVFPPQQQQQQQQQPGPYFGPPHAVQGAPAFDWGHIDPVYQNPPDVLFGSPGSNSRNASRRGISRNPGGHVGDAYGYPGFGGGAGTQKTYLPPAVTADGAASAVNYAPRCDTCHRYVPPNPGNNFNNSTTILPPEGLCDCLD